jgi:hypothetical protein
MRKAFHPILTLGDQPGLPQVGKLRFPRSICGRLANGLSFKRQLHAGGSGGLGRYVRTSSACVQMVGKVSTPCTRTR